MAGSKKGSRSSGRSRRSGPSRPVNRRTSTSASRSQEVSPAGAGAAETTATTQVRRRRFSLKRALIGVGIVALALVLVGAGYIYLQVQKTLPTTEGKVNFSGLSAPATITRDVYGVPHIEAANVKDLYAAEGYVHAQDRLFQMFLFRAVAQGRLAELLSSSPGTINADKFFRILGFYRAGKAELEQTSPDVRDALQAYAMGVNQFIHTHADSLPLEFSILGAGMEDWQPADTLAFGKLESWDLSQNWADELMAADLQKQLGPDQAAQLLPGYPADAPTIVPGESSGYAPLLDSYNRDVKPWLLGLGMEGLGSNNWVVDGTKSATGKPLLANDPHLAVRSPSIWYQIHLRTSDGKYDVTGFSFASAPGVITGHNQKIAWGVTNVGGDVQDLYIEKLDPAAHPGQYQNGDEWLPLQLITETIKVKGSAPVTQTVRLTERGPLLSDAFEADDPLGKSVPRPFSMQWTALTPGHLFESVFALQTALDWQQFRAALSKWSVPGQNFVYADTDGNIGYQMTGEFPIRKKGDGTVPQPGYTGEYGWEGTVPFDRLPRAYNPPEHFIATANNKPFGSSTLPISGPWASPWRIERIVEMLKAKKKLSVDDIKAMQLDTHSVLAQRFAPYIADLKPTDPTEKEAVAMFKGWDGDLKTDSVTAGIYEVFLQRTLTETLSDDLGRETFLNYLDTKGGAGLEAVENLLDKPVDPLWDRKDTARKETRDDILLRSLSGALADLRGGVGDNMQDWAWGKLHTITPGHPFGGQPVIGGVFSLPTQPLGGDNSTMSVGSYSFLQPFNVTNHQSYRMIVDLANWESSQAIYAGGQSGQPFSKHFGDLYPLWVKGEYNPLLYSPAAISAKKEAVLTLEP